MPAPAGKARGFDSQWLFWLPTAAALISIPATFRVYFIDWANLQETGSVYDYKAVAIRDTILATAGEGVPIYLPLACFDDAPLLFYLSDPFKREASLSSPPSDVKRALVIAPEKSQNDTVWVRLQDHTATILPPLTAEGQQLIQAAWAGSSVSTIRTADGEIAAYLASLPADPARFLLRPTRSLAVSFGPARLTGVNYPRTIDTSPGELRIPVTLFWQANARMNDEYEVLVHLVDDSRRSWGNGDARPTDWVYPTTFWRPGRDEIAAQQIVNVEPNKLPPGRYWLALSLYDPATGQRLPITEGESSSPDTFFVGPLKVPMPPPAEPPSTAQSQSARFGDVAQLLGYRVVSQPDGFTLSLYWRAEMPDGADYTVFVHLLNTEGQMVAGQDSQPVSGRYPSSIWEPGEVIADERTFSTDDLPPGEYQLEVGMYQLATGERLSVVLPDGTVEPAQRLVLTTPIQVQ
jgi:hypothetical protein